MQRLSTRALLILFCLSLLSWNLVAQPRERAALAPVGALEVSETQQRILFNRLQAELTKRYDLVSQVDFDQALEKAFNELEADECTEDNCVRMIQELLQVENFFALQLVRSGNDTQLTLTLIDLDRRQVQSDYCEACEQRELNARLDQLVNALLPSQEEATGSLMSQMEADLERQAVEAQAKIKAQRNAELIAIAELLQQGTRSRRMAGARIVAFRKQDSQGRFAAFFQQQPVTVQHQLAELYRNGVGVSKDETEAVRWHEIAARQGHAPSQTLLGYCYHHGIGVSKDQQQAVQWYQRAANQGHAMAQFNLGSMYRKGYGVAENEARALRLYRQAAANGNAQARKLLAWMEEQ